MPSASRSFQLSPPSSSPHPPSAPYRQPLTVPTRPTARRVPRRYPTMPDRYPNNFAAWTTSIYTSREAISAMLGDGNGAAVCWMGTVQKALGFRENEEQWAQEKHDLEGPHRRSRVPHPCCHEHPRHTAQLEEIKAKMDLTLELYDLAITKAKEGLWKCGRPGTRCRTMDGYGLAGKRFRGSLELAKESEGRQRRMKSSEGLLFLPYMAV